MPNHLIFEPASNTIRQLPGNYCVASFDGHSWKVEIDLAADIEFGVTLLRYFHNWENRYRKTGFDIMNDLKWGKLMNGKTYSDFKVIMVSSNTNSFGLYGVVIMNEAGVTYQIGCSKLNVPNKDSILNAVLDSKTNLVSIQGVSYEIPERMQLASENVIKQFFKQ